ncbi:MAG: thiamine pyrophosphate-dependent dehydrogenase E1 component subunit alpha [Chloroflexota bacterium]|nr:thiamine pyrophosphate-dependent dehydrogenase E1 component subunit alpha [Chloroflexota bacterium]
MTVAARGPDTLDPGLAVELLRQMVLIRRFDELAMELRLADRIYGVVHPYVGQEAVAVGVCAALRLTDRIVSNHRGHGHCIAKGADIRRMMAELFGRRDGYCKGKGGSMHIADFDVGMLGANGIVGAGLPIAAGAGLAAQLEGGDAVAVGFFGDGATGEGPFHESLNIAALWKLPVVWVCENNQYAVDTPVERGLAARDVAALAAGYGMPGAIVDGNDVLAVYEVTRAAVERARAGAGPTLLECKTWRRHQHALRDAVTPDRRPPELIAAWAARDPIETFERRLLAGGILTGDQLADLRQSLEQDLADAVAFAEASPFPAPEEALDDVFAT